MATSRGPHGIVYQVKLSPAGPWHRRQLDERGDVNGHTACGLSIDGAYLSREHTLDDKLCAVCFTDRERDTGQMKLLEKEQIERSRADAWEDRFAGDPDDEITDEHEPTGENGGPAFDPPRAPLSREESGEIDTRSNKQGRRS